MKFRSVCFHLSLFLIVFISCSDKKAKLEETDLANIAPVTPKVIISFDNIDNVYFKYIGDKSIATKNGDILISDRRLPTILLLSPDLKVKKSLLEGRGPGEILDAYEFNSDKDGNFYIYDQGNKKMLVYDDELNLIREMIPKPFEGSAITKVYPMGASNVLLELTSFEFLENKEESTKKIFIQYNLDTEFYGEKLVLDDRPFARSFMGDKIVGAVEVPFSFAQLTAHNPNNESIFMFDTRTSVIAEVDFNYDTLRVIPVSLPAELLNDAEIDSIRKDASKVKNIDSWKSMKPMLSEYKSVAENILFYNENIWLQSNLRGDYQKWFVLNMDGKIIKAVHLPKDGMVTHISEHHLGVRLDDATFGLFEAVE
ncbi:MAG: hypothetical protein JXR20_11415 [Balneola sp.]